MSSSTNSIYSVLPLASYIFKLQQNKDNLSIDQTYV